MDSIVQDLQQIVNRWSAGRDPTTITVELFCETYPQFQNDNLVRMVLPEIIGIRRCELLAALRNKGQ